MRLASTDVIAITKWSNIGARTHDWIIGRRYCRALADEVIE
jgi:hypothetical protein